MICGLVYIKANRNQVKMDVKILGAIFELFMKSLGVKGLRFIIVDVVEHFKK